MTYGRNIKKLLALLTAAAILFLCGCSDGGNDNEASAIPADSGSAIIVTPLPHDGTASPTPETDRPTDRPEVSEVPATETPATEVPTEADPTEHAAVKLAIDTSKLRSKTVLLKDIDTGEVLYSLAADTHIYPASLTKIMTGLLAAEMLDPNGAYEITKEAVDIADSMGASTAGFNAGEVTNKDGILGGILLSSAAECTITAAINIAGSQDAFVELMNKRAAEMGLCNTHFVNCIGLHNAEHYTTAEDLMILTEAALGNQEFVRFFTLDTMKAVTEPARQYQLTLISTVFSALDAYDFGNVSILGGKTGYTRQAGLCLATYALYKDHHYVLIVAANDGNKDTEKYHFIDTAYVYGVLQEAL
ncbi:MAG: D-alanyl-D-alanine carboxypeptidase [Clostridia bacterium]|nr:D-alanyl-D-alanine carboxypeptidase [Clostridia bacterium]